MSNNNSDYEPEEELLFPPPMSSTMKLCLGTAFVLLHDHILDYIVAESKGEDIRETKLWELLPKDGRPLLDRRMAGNFLIALHTIAYKILEPTATARPGCLADELLLHLALQEAEVVAETHDFEVPDDEIESIRDWWFENEDYMFFYEDKLEGIDKTEIGRTAGIVDMAVEYWFHPYVSHITNPLNWPDGADFDREKLDAEFPHP